MEPEGRGVKAASMQEEEDAMVLIKGQRSLWNHYC
jgi:hypothetical protein